MTALLSLAASPNPYGICGRASYREEDATDSDEWGISDDEEPEDSHGAQGKVRWRDRVSMQPCNLLTMPTACMRATSPLAVLQALPIT